MLENIVTELKYKLSISNQEKSFSEHFIPYTPDELKSMQIGLEDFISELSLPELFLELETARREKTYPFEVSDLLLDFYLTYNQYLDQPVERINQLMKRTNDVYRIITNVKTRLSLLTYINYFSPIYENNDEVIEYFNNLIISLDTNSPIKLQFKSFKDSDFIFMTQNIQKIFETEESIQTKRLLVEKELYLFVQRSPQILNRVKIALYSINFPGFAKNRIDKFKIAICGPKSYDFSFIKDKLIENLSYSYDLLNSNLSDDKYKKYLDENINKKSRYENKRIKRKCIALMISNTKNHYAISGFDYKNEYGKESDLQSLINEIHSFLNSHEKFQRDYTIDSMVTYYPKEFPNKDNLVQPDKKPTALKDFKSNYPDYKDKICAKFSCCERKILANSTNEKKYKFYISKLPCMDCKEAFLHVNQSYQISCYDENDNYIKDYKI